VVAPPRGCWGTVSRGTPRTDLGVRYGRSGQEFTRRLVLSRLSSRVTQHSSDAEWLVLGPELKYGAGFDLSKFGKELYSLQDTFQKYFPFIVLSDEQHRITTLHCVGGVCRYFALVLNPLDGNGVPEPGTTIRRGWSFDCRGHPELYAI
jgi:hypothetical protein